MHYIQLDTPLDITSETLSHISNQITHVGITRGDFPIPWELISGDHITKLEARITELEDEVDQSVTKNWGLEDKIYDLTNDIDNLNDKLSDRDTTIEELNQKLNDLM